MRSLISKSKRASIRRPSSVKTSPPATTTNEGQGVISGDNILNVNELDKDFGILYAGSALLFSTESPHKLILNTQKKRWEVSVSQLIEIMEKQDIEFPIIF